MFFIFCCFSNGTCTCILYIVSCHNYMCYVCETQKMLENVVKCSEFGYTREQRYTKVVYYYYKWFWSCLPLNCCKSTLCLVHCALLLTTDTHMLEIQQYKHKTHGFHTFSCFGPHIWNPLPQDLSQCSTLSYFKAKLKTFLFSQYFHPN